MPSSENVTVTPVSVSNVFSTASSEPGGIANVRVCGSTDVVSGAPPPESATLSCQARVGSSRLGSRF